MNHVDLIGWVASDPQATVIDENGNAKRTFFYLAVNFGTRNSEKGTHSDFIPCLCYDKSAVIIDKYVKKGSRIGVSGRINSAVVRFNGKKRQDFKVIVTEIYFLDTLKGKGDKANNPESADLEF